LTDYIREYFGDWYIAPPAPVCTADLRTCQCTECIVERRSAVAATHRYLSEDTMPVVVELLPLVCPTCRRDYGHVRVEAHVLPDTPILVSPVCLGCRAEGR
jgi:hypothetical protein